MVCVVDLIVGFEVGENRGNGAREVNIIEE